ncbi:hypothetical protein ULMA_09970 [Patiriisocius marinus]|uniref:histidine kinase n=1 Tax=Patiriisocius marinus TaxID=1397112 RepID=A0A5J4INE6_9FLAO|nr:HAMP domain-containing sensor histidine kinase [Patiriisocius marinus]GER58889.1 hypothetical protein ULMA_09970 [Patiriisocius marinus]
MNFFKKNSHWLLLTIFLVIVGFFFFYLHSESKQNELEARLLKLENQHNRSIDKLTSSIDKFAGLVAGMRSYMNMSTELPSTENFQNFVKNQYSDLKLDDSIVVSYVNTSHVFMQSFTRNTIDPVNLVGQSVKDFRTKEKMKNLDELMTHDALSMFPPLNLLEGWVGLPMNFRVHRKGVTVGYVAPIISFKAILDDIYKEDLDNEFVFRFITEEGFDFDREIAHNNTTVYTTKSDTEYYKNYDIDTSQFLYTTKNFYGFDLTIGTAYKFPLEENTAYSSLLFLWYFTISLLAIIITWQVNRFKKLNVMLYNNNMLLLQNKEEISDKNNELQKLNITQTKFFSIIGHDIKQPLNGIEGLLSLLKYEKIDDPDLAEIIRSLEKSTNNTTNLLNNLLRWARSQTGDIQYVPTSLNLSVILEEVIETAHSQAKEKQITIIYEPQLELRYIGDRDMLSTIFRNLISNAIKFTNLGGTIEIETQKVGNTIEITVNDSGIGMSAEEVDSLFKLDTQITTVGTSGETGTGLGLILCHMFVKNHDGHILVNSEPEVGTQFTIVLPNEL